MCICEGSLECKNVEFIGSFPETGAGIKEASRSTGMPLDKQLVWNCTTSNLPFIPDKAVLTSSWKAYIFFLICKHSSKTDELKFLGLEDCLDGDGVPVKTLSTTTAVSSLKSIVCLKQFS